MTYEYSEVLKKIKNGQLSIIESGRGLECVELTLPFLVEIIETMDHACQFINSTKRMNYTGVELYIKTLKTLKEIKKGVVK